VRGAGDDEKRGPWTEHVNVGVTEEQHEYLGVLAKGRRAAMREKQVLGRVGKADRGAVVRELIDAAMKGTPYRAVMAAAAQREAEPPSLLSLYPAMVDRVAFEDLPRALEIMHNILGALWKRARTYRMGPEIMPASTVAQAAPRWIGGGK
jgi:hypothetical protein